MKNFTWRIGLVFWMLRYGYCGIRHALWAWSNSADECWTEYRDDGYSPKESVLYDMSYN